MKTIQNLKAVIFFAGVDGLGKGLRKAGFNIKLSTDYWDKAKEAWMNNLPGRHSSHLEKHLISEGDFLLADMFDKEFEEKWLQYYEENYGHRPAPLEIDLVAGGPPCVYLSDANRKASSFGYTNELIFKYLEFATKKIKPKVILMEQVSSILKKKKLLHIKRRLEAYLNSCNNEYIWRIEELNAADYGCNQRRKRMILIMVHKSLGQEVMYPTKIPRTAKQYLSNIIPGVTEFTNKFRKNKPVKWKSTNQIMTTITATGGERVKRGENISEFTLGELLRVCEMVHYNLWGMSYKDQHKLLGNMVLISLAYHIGLAIKKTILMATAGDLKLAA